MVKINITLGSKTFYTLIAIISIAILSVFVYAYAPTSTTANPAIMGHSANEIEGAISGGGNKISLDTPIIVWNTKSSIANGTIQAGVTSGLPSGAKSVLLYVSIDHNDGRSAGAYYKQPSQTTWKKLLYGNIYYPLANSVWLPLDSNGKLEWKIDSANQVELIEIQGYEA